MVVSIISDYAKACNMQYTICECNNISLHNRTKRMWENIGSFFCVIRKEHLLKIPIWRDLIECGANQ